jgi:hypothetical protein
MSRARTITCEARQDLDDAVVPSGRMTSIADAIPSIRAASQPDARTPAGPERRPTR